MRVVLTILGALAIAALVVGAGGSSPTSQQLPPFPLIYSGNVTIGGAPAPDGLRVVARIEGLSMDPVTTSNGRYSSLAVSIPDRSYVGKTITFHIEEVQAAETDVYQEVNIILNPAAATKTLDLTFPRLPASISRTPTINATPPIIGDPSLPGLPPIALLVGLLLLVAGAAGLRLARATDGEEQNRFGN